MRIGCLQFAPLVGDIDNNLNRADSLLNRADPEDLDLLVLPELAFSGYNFQSLREISPYLESSWSGITSLWSRTTALKHDCHVVVGYPEKVDLTVRWPTNPEYYNSALVVNGDGEDIANYRKTHLYYTDETWALEGDRGFYQGFLQGLGQTAIGICMDINPYRFERPWTDYEFANHVLFCNANLVIVSMAWLTNEDTRDYSRMPQTPDVDTLMYWVSRFEPLIRAEGDGEIIIVFANRCGSEGDVTYAGTSAVIGIQSGEVRVYGLLGRGDKELLVVDTNATPYAKLVHRPVIGGTSDTPAGRPAQGTPSPSSEFAEDRPEDEAKPCKSALRDGTAEKEHQRGNAPSGERPPRRNDLSISITRAEGAKDRVDKEHSVPTPSAPSPTPHSIRPRLVIAPAHPITQQYLDSQTPTSAHPHDPNILSPKVLGGEVKFFDGPSSAISPSAASESRFSDASYDSRQVYWIDAKRNSLMPIPARRTPSEEDVIIDSEPNSAVSERDLHPSMRPDLSTWNHYTGRAMHPNLSGRGRPVPDSKPQDHTNAGCQTDSVATPQRPESPKSRHASRSRGQERSNSAAGQRVAMDGVSQRLEDLVTHSASMSLQPSDRISQGGAPRSRRDSSTDRMSSSRRCRGSSRQSRDNSSSRYYIDSERLSRTRERSQSMEPMDRSGEMNDSSSAAARSDHLQKDRQRSNSSQRQTHHRQTDSGNIYRSRLLSNTADESSTRPFSRGRQREMQRSAGVSGSITPQRTQDIRHRSSSNRPDEVNTTADLSQYRLIEEYPSANCPLHGERSPSGARAGRHSASVTRPATTDQTSALPRTRMTRSTHNTPQPPNRRHGIFFPGLAPTPAKAETRSHNAEPWSDGKRRIALDTNLGKTPESSENSSGREPTTPTAMTLVYDGKDDSGNGEFRAIPITTLGQSRSQGISRPQSAVW